MIYIILQKEKKKKDTCNNIHEKPDPEDYNNDNNNNILSLASDRVRFCPSCIKCIYTYGCHTVTK